MFNRYTLGGRTWLSTSWQKPSSPIRTPSRARHLRLGSEDKALKIEAKLKFVQLIARAMSCSSRNWTASATGANPSSSSALVSPNSSDFFASRFEKKQATDWADALVRPWELIVRTWRLVYFCTAREVGVNCSSLVGTLILVRVLPFVSTACWSSVANTAQVAIGNIQWCVISKQIGEGSLILHWQWSNIVHVDNKQ